MMITMFMQTYMSNRMSQQNQMNMYNYSGRNNCLGNTESDVNIVLKWNEKDN